MANYKSNHRSLPSYDKAFFENLLVPNTIYIGSSDTRIHNLIGCFMVKSPWLLTPGRPKVKVPPESRTSPKQFTDLNSIASVTANISNFNFSITVFQKDFDLRNTLYVGCNIVFV